MVCCFNVATIHPIVSVPPIGHFFKNNLQSQTSELKDGTHGTKWSSPTRLGSMTDIDVMCLLGCRCWEVVALT